MSGGDSRKNVVIRKKTLDLPSVHFDSLLFICALLPALLFKGPQIEFFMITQILLVIWFGRIALQSFDRGLSLPRTSLALCLTLFWLWLALSLTWSLAPNISVINFWWVGSLVLVFWLYTLTPERDQIWRSVAAILLVLGLVLGLMGVYQAQVFEQQARSIFETRNTHAAFLNMVSLPASAYFLLLQAEKDTARVHPVLLGAVLYILFFSIFMTASRGATLSFVLSMSVLTVFSVRRVPGRAIGILLGLITIAFLSAKFLPGGGELFDRLPQIAQDSGRLLIWESSWNLLQNSPWHGIGLGLFYLAYPPYRHPQDNSGGFFAHNDYLQVWIETGWPGLLLLLAVLGAVAWLLWRAWREADDKTRIEMTGLFCGLLAVASHSFVDFNFYILSIMMVTGLMLGRFHELAVRALRSPSIQLRPSRWVGKRAYPFIVTLLFLFPLLYFFALGLANSYYEKGLSLAQQGRLEEADKSLVSAHRLTPSDDRILIAHADLYRHAITQLPPEAAESRSALYQDAIKFLDHAKAANPLRGLTLVIRGRLYQQNEEIAGTGAQEQAMDSLRLALALNPKLFQGRMDYAALLLRTGRKSEALQALDEGAKYEYYPMPDLIPFYALTARLRREAGRPEEARILENKVQELEKQAKASYYLRGY